MLAAGLIVNQCVADYMTHSLCQFGFWEENKSIWLSDVFRAWLTRGE
jgi:hypothetical protein